MRLRRSGSSLRHWRKTSGFSLLEMVFASAILLAAVASVVQLVPTSLQSNLYNRMDTTATTIAQHYLDLMLAQPLSTYSFQVANPDTTLPPFAISLGDLSNPGNTVGSPVIMQGSAAAINFSGNPVTGYSLSYKDPNDPAGATFDVRWAVIPALNNPANSTTNNVGGVLMSRRIIVGCRQTNAAQLMMPVSLDSSVQK